ncbi:unnamed protein product (macronuclear) [Paramecium tetraurelia]|uniref:Uncharacterized protein n=1 Tax=Paramecium tetraurelia TaxID=5888 RepID=A0CN39_PARTE|nr:uncharacterized protein GSPATT00008647001 [Paramecium tetraurelia]CAK72206.1 unnamed protein product [Paramecium tetraurelia]|eukprot:XP_001439603.1 hypothetical protein (macronuclear) [Paramecium tetraurelia strain d4-2]
MSQDLKKYQVYEEDQIQMSINEQSNQIEQTKKKLFTKFENDNQNDLNCTVQKFQATQQQKSLNIPQKQRNSSYQGINDDFYDKLLNNKQTVQFDNHVEKLQKSQQFRRSNQYKSLSNRYTSSEGGYKYDQMRQANLLEDNQIDSINKYEYYDSKYEEFGNAQTNVLQYYQRQKLNEVYRKRQDQLSCSFYSKNSKKLLIKTNQTIYQGQIKEEQDHNDSSDTNQSRISKNISESDQKDQQFKYEDIQSIRISKMSDLSDQIKNDLYLEDGQGTENSLGSDFHYFDSNKSSLNQTPQRKSLRDIKFNKSQVPSLKIQQQENETYFSQASSPQQKNQDNNQLKKQLLTISIEGSGSGFQSNLISPIVGYHDNGLHKNTMSFGRQQGCNSYQKSLKKNIPYCISPFDCNTPINEESKIFNDLIKWDFAKNKQIEKEQARIRDLKTQSVKKQQNYEYEKKIKELEQELKLKEEQIEQLEKIQYYNQRISLIPNEDDWNSDFHNIREFIDDYKSNLYQLISNKNSNISFINLMKITSINSVAIIQLRQINKHLKNNPIRKIISIQKHQILSPIFENIILLQQKSLAFGFEFGHAVPELFQKLFSLSKREKFRNRLLDMNECVKYEIQELNNFLKNQNKNQSINELKETLESEIIIQKYIQQTIYNISNLFKERILQIQEGHKQMQEQLKKNTLCN